jgi:hypothetical protein
MSLALVRIAIIAFSACVAGFAVSASAADGPALLFAKGTGKLTASEQREIFTALGLKLAPDGKSFEDTVCGQPAGAEADHNYGDNFIFWDLVFGTYFHPQRREVEALGIAGLAAFPNGYLAQLASPLRWRRIEKESRPL